MPTLDLRFMSTESVAYRNVKVYAHFYVLWERYLVYFVGFLGVRCVVFFPRKSRRS